MVTEIRDSVLLRRLFESRELLNTREGNSVGRLLLVFFLAILFVFLWRQRDVVQSMVEAWSRTQTYQHGFLVVPAVLVLIWYRRRNLHFSEIRVETLGLFAILASIGIGYIGTIADLQVVRHFALALTVVSLVLTLLGRHVFLKLKFPLLFLLFAVPAGDELVPPLIDLTATIATEGLRLFGVPVWREGVYIEIPHGRFEVARVCSGIRYLIASMAFATFYAAMQLRSPSRRFLFVSIGVILPLFANGLRALGIISLAYLSDMRIAVGVDHIIYGWLFFGVIVVLLLWIGNWMGRSEQPSNMMQSNSDSSHLKSSSVISMVMVPIVCTLLVLPQGFIPNAVNGPLAQSEFRPGMPLHVGNWAGPVPITSVLSSGFIGTDGEIAGNYQTETKQNISLNISYYFRQQQGREIVNTENSLVNKDAAMIVGSTVRRVSDPEGIERKVNEATVRRGNDSFIVWSWFDVDGVRTISPLKAKLIQISNSLHRRETPAALVTLISAANVEQEMARNQLGDFLFIAGSSISECLWQGEAGREGCSDDGDRH